MILVGRRLRALTLMLFEEYKQEGGAHYLSNKSINECYHINTNKG
ncbi:MAG TPA: hypothetical protein VD815_00170 [Candidatus Saccharimonadales bacterium]|nr:hypothetical protein [Candidatus Saccharimonadales bacterium]